MREAFGERGKPQQGNQILLPNGPLTAGAPGDEVLFDGHDSRQVKRLTRRALPPGRTPRHFGLTYTFTSLLYS